MQYIPKVAYAMLRLGIVTEAYIIKIWRPLKCGYREEWRKPVGQNITNEEVLAGLEKKKPYSFLHLSSHKRKSHTIRKKQRK